MRPACRPGWGSRTRRRATGSPRGGTSRGRGGRRGGVRLASCAPRDGLAPGKQSAVRKLQPRFGPLSYEIDTAAGSVHASIDLPTGFAGTVRLRLRLPAGEALGATTAHGG